MKFENENGNVKIMIAVIVLLVSVILGIVIFKVASKDRTVAVIEEDPYEYFALYSTDEKVGVVDRKGKTLIKPEYTTIYIPNQSKEVFFCFKDEEYKILDSKGKDIFTEFSSVSSGFSSGSHNSSGTDIFANALLETELSFFSVLVSFFSVFFLNGYEKIVPEIFKFTPTGTICDG